jgi:hypothetical protein
MHGAILLINSQVEFGFKCLITNADKYAIDSMMHVNDDYVWSCDGDKIKFQIQ